MLGESKGGYDNALAKSPSSPGQGGPVGGGWADMGWGMALKVGMALKERAPRAMLMGSAFLDLDRPQARAGELAMVGWPVGPGRPRRLSSRRG